MKSRLWILAVLALLLALQGPTHGQSAFTATTAQLEAVSQPRGEAAHDYSFRSADARKAADIGSWAIVSAESGLYGKRAWQEPDRKRSVLCTLGELAATSASVRGIKALVGRERPDLSNRQSFPSGHAAFAALMQGDFRGEQGRRWGVLLWPLSVAAGRVLSKRHWPTDTIAGAALGWVVSATVCP